VRAIRHRAYLTGEIDMNKMIIATLTALLTCGSALAADASPDAAADSKCEAAAIDKNGKPLVGAAKSSFMQKCHREAMHKTDCEARALSKDGKPLAGAAKNSFMRKCEEDMKQAAPAGK
jgi:hypothetical protein